MTTCKQCKTPLPAESTQRRVFCSVRCRVAAHRAKQLAELERLRKIIAENGIES